jgi:pyruvate-ferredoxin/flavodoxin oxidoreductase
MVRNRVVIDGNEAAAHVAFKTSEVIAIYPITPSSNMGEWADAWSAAGHKNIWGTVPLVQEMQSEGGAAGAVHGSLQTGALSTTFTASQGLLLMIPNMYKIAGELTSTVFHIAARAIAAQGLSIFGDHQDVMSTRATGWAMLSSASVQEALDMALIAHASTLEARVPFLHFFDGFRTSHEELKIELFEDDDIRAMIGSDHVAAHRQRALTPDRPVMRGTAQNPDVYFQGRETVNPFYNATPGIVQKYMDKLAGIVGRQYRLFEYYGAADAERVIVAMGSGCGAIEEAIDVLNAQGYKVGLVKVRLYRPWSPADLLAAIPATAKTIAVLDRTKEPGSAGEPLYQDVITAITEALMDGTSKFAALPKVIGGRYGLGSKEFTPAMAKGIYDEMAKAQPKNHFAVGIHDDVLGISINYDPNFSTEGADVVRAMFWGLGADGTVGANKNSIKIIGEETDFYAQGYYVYDSKKSGSLTVSHLRFGPRPIKSTYLIDKANFVACHQFVFMEMFPVLDTADHGATFLLNSPYSVTEVWDTLPRTVQKQIIEKEIKFFVIDAAAVAKATGMFPRINTIMQTCFFAISNVLPREEAITKIKESIRKTYSKRGEAVVLKNFAAVDETLANLFEVKVTAAVTSKVDLPPVVSAKAPEFVQKITAEMMANRGNDLPVSAMPVDGTFPTGTTQWEKRNIAMDVPVWETDLCIQCGKCVLVCPHAVIRAKLAGKEELEGAPESFKHMPAKWKEHADKEFVLGFAVEDCTGCSLCVEVCPAKDKTNVSRKAINMQPQLPLRAEGRKNWERFLDLPNLDRTAMGWNNVKNAQLLEPLFEFSGACAGCGETPYVKLVSQLFGDRMVVANATGCSSIYGGNLPTTPWTQNKDGRGPAWSNSLFEDNAEFGLGIRLALDKQTAYAAELVDLLKEQIGADLAEAILNADQSGEAGIGSQRARVAELKAKLAGLGTAKAKDLLGVADYLVKKSVWIMGGDGWAYDIGYGGLDHVIASGANVNILVLDTEVYSNTGGQASKSTPRGAVAKFAAGGKPQGKKNLGLIAMSYGNVYVAQIAMGANDAQTIKAIMEAEAYEGPSIIIAYSHCIAHGIDMAKGMVQQKLAVESGHWPLYRFDPRLHAQGKNPLQLEYKGPQIPLKDYIYNETRFRMLVQSNPAAAEKLLGEAQEEVKDRWELLKNKAGV